MTAQTSNLKQGAPLKKNLPKSGVQLTLERFDRENYSFNNNMGKSLSLFPTYYNKNVVSLN